MLNQQLVFPINELRYRKKDTLRAFKNFENCLYRHLQLIKLIFIKLQYIKK